MRHWISFRVAGAALLTMVCSGLTFGQQTTAPTQQDMMATSTTTTASTQSGVPQLQQRNPRYRLQRGDQVALNFTFTPEFNESVIVQPDGFISLREIGDIHAEGMTLPELTQSLQAAYSKILHDPVLSVTPQEFVHPYFVAQGELGKPGKYDLHGDTTVTEAIAMAGGFTPASKHSQVVLFRRVSPDLVQATKLDVKHMLKSGNLAEDMRLQPGDMLFVPKNLISKIGPFMSYNVFRATYSIH
jgi:polysaccharide export outer membrane protein